MQQPRSTAEQVIDCDLSSSSVQSLCPSMAGRMLQLGTCMCATIRGCGMPSPALLYDLRPFIALQQGLEGLLFF